MTIHIECSQPDHHNWRRGERVLENNISPIMRLGRPEENRVVLSELKIGIIRRDLQPCTTRTIQARFLRAFEVDLKTVFSSPARISLDTGAIVPSNIDHCKPDR